MSFRHIDPEDVDTDCDVCGRPLSESEVEKTTSGAELCPDCYKQDPT